MIRRALTRVLMHLVFGPDERFSALGPRDSPAPEPDPIGSFGGRCHYRVSQRWCRSATPRVRKIHCARRDGSDGPNSSLECTATHVAARVAEACHTLERVDALRRMWPAEGVTRASPER